jgi:threonine dehydrogenase-like Zn-dependent dehydrogenase
MRALFFDGNLRLADLPVPVPAGNEALIRMRAAGICSTDIEIMKGYMAFEGIPGHEFVGEVVDCPDDPGIVGQRVVGEINLPCGRCDICSAGLARHCPDRTVLGISGKDGVFAEYLTLPSANLHVVPGQVPDRAAVFTEPLAAAMEIPEQIDISRKHRVAVLGDGKLGILVCQVLREKTDHLVCFGRMPEKAAVLSDLGIHVEPGASPEDEFFHVVVDCTGSPEGLKTSLRAVRPRGTVVVKSTYAGSVSLDFALPVIKEITIVGSRCGPFPAALGALRAGGVRVGGMVSRVFPLARGLEAFEAAADPRSLKVMITNDIPGHGAAPGKE